MTHRVYMLRDGLDDTLDALVGALESARVALNASAELLRPQLPSFADNVIGAHIKIIDMAIAKVTP